MLATSTLILAGIGQTAPSAAQQPAAIVDEDQVSAVVESVNQTERSILLRGPQGGLLTVIAGPEVRNFAQIKPGDRVVVRYREAFAASLAKPGTSAPPMQATEHADRARPGEKPRVSQAHMIRARVTITGVDPRHNQVSFVGPARIDRTVEVADPEMQRFLRTLKVGDQVDLTYTEAVAASVEPAGQ